MLTVTDYLAKAAELDARAAECEPGSSQDAFTYMARQWRDLAARSRFTEPLSWAPPSRKDNDWRE